MLIPAKSRSQTLGHALDVLEAFGAARELGVSDLAKRLGLPKTVVHRILVTLEARHYLRQDPVSRKYLLTPRLWELGRLAIDRLDLQEASRDALHRLVAKTGETAYLSVLRGTEVLYLAKAEGREPLRLYVDLGGRGPAYCTASGKAHLAYAGPEPINELFRRPLARLTRRTITDRGGFLRELANIRRAGVSVNLGERRDDIGAVAAAVFNHEGRCVAAIGIAGPLPRFSRDKLPLLIKAVKAAAAEISRRCGYRDRAQEPGVAGSRLRIAGRS